MARLQNGPDRAGLLLIAAGALALIAGLAIVRLALWSDGVPSPADVPLSDVFDPDAVAADRDFRRPVRVLAIISALIVPLVGIAAIVFSARLSRLLLGLGRGRVLVGGALAGALLAAVTGLARFPFGALINERLRDGGVVRRGTLDWARDAMVAIGVEALIFALAIAALALAINRLPRAWPAALAGALTLLAVGITFAAPAVIQPLFEDTRPVEDAALVAEITALAAEAGVPVGEVVVNDAATRSRTFNARVEGIGATRRVVLFDTLIDEGDRDQLRWTVAHELAHEKHDHILKGLGAWTVMTVPLALVVAGLVALLTGAGASRPAAPLVLRRVVIAAGAIVILLAVSAPVQNAVSRAYEAEADWTALAITDEPVAAIRARAASRMRARSDPDPPRALHVWFGSHPTHLERVGLAVRAQEGR